MMKQALIILFFAIAVFSSDLKKLKTYYLSKDEIKKVMITAGKTKKLLTFRWTLYKNEGLVMFSSYDQMVMQYILYLNHTNQQFRIDLTSGGSNLYLRPYLLIRFDKFDFAKHKAKISLWIYDKQSEIEIKKL